MHDIPSKSYVCGYHSAVIMREMILVVYQFRNEIIWDQVFTDSMRYQQVDLQNFITGFIKDDKFKTIVLSTSIIVEEKRQNLRGINTLKQFIMVKNISNK